MTFYCNFCSNHLSKSKLQYLYRLEIPKKKHGIRRKPPQIQRLKKGDVHGFSPNLSPFLAGKNPPSPCLVFRNPPANNLFCEAFWFQCIRRDRILLSCINLTFFRLIPGFLRGKRPWSPAAPQPLRTSKLPMILAFFKWMSVLGMGELLD